MRKTDNIIVSLVFGIPLIIFVVVIIYNSFWNSTSGKDYYLQNKKEIAVNGVVDSIYRKEFSHNVLVLRVNKETLYLPPEWEMKFRIGDSVVKFSGNLSLKQYRNGKLIEELNYTNVIMK